MSPVHVLSRLGEAGQRVLGVVWRGVAWQGGAARRRAALRLRTSEWLEASHEALHEALAWGHGAQNKGGKPRSE